MACLTKRLQPHQMYTQVKTQCLLYFNNDDQRTLHRTLTLQKRKTYHFALGPFNKILDFLVDNLVSLGLLFTRKLEASQ